MIPNRYSRPLRSLSPVPLEQHPNNVPPGAVSPRNPLLTQLNQSSPNLYAPQDASAIHSLRESNLLAFGGWTGQLEDPPELNLPESALGQHTYPSNQCDGQALNHPPYNHIAASHGYPITPAIPTQQSATHSESASVISPSNSSRGGHERRDEWVCCGMGFNDKKDLIHNREAHADSHTDDRYAFRCRRGCNQAFQYPNDRKSHESNVHDGKKLATCRYCTKRLSRRDNCLRHEKNCRLRTSHTVSDQSLIPHPPMNGPFAGPSTPMVPSNMQGFYTNQQPQEDLLEFQRDNFNGTSAHVDSSSNYPWQEGPMNGPMSPYRQPNFPQQFFPGNQAMSPMMAPGATNDYYDPNTLHPNSYSTNQSMDPHQYSTPSGRRSSRTYSSVPASSAESHNDVMDLDDYEDDPYRRSRRHGGQQG